MVFVERTKRVKGWCEYKPARPYKDKHVAACAAYEMTTRFPGLDARARAGRVYARWTGRKRPGTAPKRDRSRAWLIAEVKRLRAKILRAIGGK
jgi:hypothetical protein